MVVQLEGALKEGERNLSIILEPHCCCRTGNSIVDHC